MSNRMPITPFSRPVYVSQPLLPDPDAVLEKIRIIWNNRYLTNNGPMARTLEALLSDFLGAGHLSVFSNGTVALQIACRALDLSGEVITTPFTFAATPHSLAWNGVTPVFCDIDDRTLNMDPGKIEERITSRTTAILPVHVFGYPCDVKAIEEIARKYGLKVLYDAAHAFGVKVDGVPVGTFGDISMFSFHATKVYHTVEGGALTFAGGELKERADRLRNFGIRSEEMVEEPGTNGKLNELQAAVGILVLDQVEAEIARRKELTCLYRRLLADIPGISFKEDLPDVEHNYSYFTIRVDRESFGLSRDELYLRLKEYNVFARKYFYPLCSTFPCYKDLPSASPDTLPVAVKAAGQVLALPLHGSLADEDVEKICEIIGSCS